MPPTVGDHCTADHGNAGPCTWDGTAWTRTDQVQPCPYDQSNTDRWPDAE